MRPFAFRQRVGDVNWRAVSSVDVEQIVDDNKIEELQSIIDDVTFCDVKSSDIKGNTIHSTKKLVHLMQLMLEYLLYCQESQLQLVRNLHQKNHHMKSRNKIMTQKNESAKEDIRIYRRQIAMMKESIKNLNIKDTTVEQPPRVFDPIKREPNTTTTNTTTENFNPIIDSMLQHERETRNFVKDIITEQRHSFLSEFEKISRNVQQASGRPNTLTSEDIERKLQSNMDTILSELRKSQFTRQDSAGTSQENVDLLERERKKLRDYERQIERREDKLTNREDKLLENEEKLSLREKEIQDRTHDLDMREIEVQKSKSRDVHNGQGNVPKAIVSQRSVGVNTPAPEAVAVKTGQTNGKQDHAIAFNMLMRMMRRGTKDKCQFAFIHWKNLTVVERQATHEGQVFQLKTENHNYLSEVTMLQEQNQALQSQLVSEKEKNMIESSRANTLQRKLKEFEVAKIMAVQTSVDKPAVLKKKTPVNDFETEEQMMDIVLKRIEGQLVDPDVEKIVESLAGEIMHKTDDKQQ